MKKKESSVTLSIERENDILHLESSRGYKWEVPSNLSKEAALSALVYDTLLQGDEFESMIRDNYKITLIIEHK